MQNATSETIQTATTTTHVFKSSQVKQKLFHWKTERIWEVKVQLHSFLTLALEWGSASGPGCFNQKKRSPNIHWNFCPSQKFFRHPASPCKDYAITVQMKYHTVCVCVCVLYDSQCSKQKTTFPPTRQHVLLTLCQKELRTFQCWYHYGHQQSDPTASGWNPIHNLTSSLLRIHCDIPCTSHQLLSSRCV